MAGHAIVAEELSYWYGDLIAVNQISFSVSEGEIVGFLGPNGAGKTTTVKMLTGQLKPKGGKATLLGMDVASHVEEVQGDIGVCFEETNLYEKMSAIENLKLFARLFGVKDFNPDILLIALRDAAKRLLDVIRLCLVSNSYVNSCISMLGNDIQAATPFNHSHVYGNPLFEIGQGM